MAATAAASLVDPGPALTRLIAEQSAQGCDADHALGRLVGTLPLSRPGGVVQPYGVKIGGRGLDARLNTDLSKLEPDRLITPTDQIYLRTECPPAVAAHQGPWTITTSGLLAKPSTVPLDDVIRRARPMGAHLLECSGNNNPANFGLMSVAEWDGVPLRRRRRHAAAVTSGHSRHGQRRRPRSAVGHLDSRGELGLRALDA